MNVAYVASTNILSHRFNLYETMTAGLGVKQRFEFATARLGAGDALAVGRTSQCNTNDLLTDVFIVKDVSDGHFNLTAVSIGENGYICMCHEALVTYINGSVTFPAKFGHQDIFVSTKASSVAEVFVTSLKRGTANLVGKVLARHFWRLR